MRLLLKRRWHWPYLVLALTTVILSRPVGAADWPMFGRDQTRNAVSPEKNPPTWWQVEKRDQEGKLLLPSKNIRWSADLNGGGALGRTYGDPVVVDGMIWIGTNDGNGKDAAVLVCLDEKTGKVLYRYVSPRLEYAINDGQDWNRRSMACSPLIEGDRMWFMTNRCEVVCLHIGPLKKRQGDPRELWKVDMRKDLGVSFRGCHLGYRLCSIAFHRDWIYVITGNGVGVGQFVSKVVAPEAPSLVCFNKNTGKVVWQDNSPGNNILFSQYASPTVIEINGQAQVVAPQGDGWLRSFDAATGKLLWKFDTNPPDAKWELGANGTRNHLPASAVFHENRLYIGNGQDAEHWGGPAWLYCIDPTKAGDISLYLPDGPGKGKPNPNSGMVWKYGGIEKNTKTPIFDCTLSNVAVHNWLVIAPDIVGTIHCLDARTSQQYWTHQTGGIWGSPLIVDGKIYVGTLEGDVWILDLAKEKKLLAQIKMDRDVCCSPIFANGVLYVANNNTLFAIAGKDPRPVAK